MNLKYLSSARRPMSALRVVTLAAVCFCAPVLAATKTDGNNALLAGAEAFENIAESALTLDQATYVKLFADYRANATAVNNALTPTQRNELRVNVVGVERRWKGGDRNAVALDAVEAYRTLVSAVDRKALPVPVNVALLDYTGFRLNALLAGGKSPNWPAIWRTVVEGQGFWRAIKPQIKDDTLADAMDRSMSALETAAKERNPRLLGYAADMDLILVDGLEAYYARPNMR